MGGALESAVVHTPRGAWGPSFCKPLLIRGSGLLVAEGSSHAKVFRCPSVDTMLENLAQDEPLGVSVAPVAPDPLNRFLGWGTSWVFWKDGRCVPPLEKARVWSKIVSANSTESLHIALRRADSMLDDGQVSTSAGQVLFSTFVCRASSRDIL